MRIAHDNSKHLVHPTLAATSGFFIGKDYPMPSGGKRVGAGRPPGAKNKFSKTAREAIARAEDAGGRRSVVDWLIGVVHDDKQSIRTRLDAAKTVIGYLVPRLSSSEVAGADGGPITFVISEDDANL
jgi:hypothetical protein